MPSREKLGPRELLDGAKELISQAQDQIPSTAHKAASKRPSGVSIGATEPVRPVSAAKKTPRRRAASVRPESNIDTVNEPTSRVTDFDPPATTENTNLGSIPIPLYDGMLLLRLQAIKQDPRGEVLDGRSKEYAQKAGLISKDDLGGLDEAGVAKKVLDRVEGKFQIYTDLLKTQVTLRLENEGMNAVVDEDAFLGDDDKSSVKHKKEEILKVLWRGTVATQSDATQRRIRELEAEYEVAVFRSYGLHNLDNYLLLNIMRDLRGIKVETTAELAVFLSSHLTDKDGDSARKFLSGDFDESVEARTDQEYKDQIKNFDGDVTVLFNKNDRDQFNKFEDIEDFINKIKLVARNRDDVLILLAKKLHEAAAMAAGKKVSPADRAQSVRDEAKRDQEEKNNAKWKIWKRFKRRGKDKDKVSPETGNSDLNDETDEPEKPTEPGDSKKSAHKKGKKQGVGLVGRGVLGTTALFAAIGGGGAILLGELFGKDNGETVNNTINIGSGASVGDINNTNINNNYGLVDNRSSKEGVQAPTAAPGGDVYKIKTSDQLSQQDAKAILDLADGNKDGKITFRADDKGSFDNSIESKFKLLGANGHDLENDKLYVKTHTGTHTNKTIVLDGLGQDVVTLAARLAGRDIPQGTQENIKLIGAEPDSTILLIDNLIAKPQYKATPTVEPTASPTASETPKTAPEKTPTISPSITATPTASSTPVPTRSVTATPAVDVPTATPKIGEILKIDTKRYQREQMMALAYNQGRSFGDFIPFGAPLFGVLTQTADYRIGLRKRLRLQEDDEEDEEDKVVNKVENSTS